MSKIISPGKCRLCGRRLGKAQMTTHLKACVKRAAATALAQTRKPARCFHLVVEATYAPEYWLHLEVPAHSTFAELDHVLRDIWLECCDHMSAFHFPRKPFLPMPTAADLNEMFIELLELSQRNFEQQIEEERRLMILQVGKRLARGVKFEYEYDFGSPTHLSLRVVDDRPSSLPKAQIRLLARNDPPEIRCVKCQKPASQICSGCCWEGHGALCNTCARRHECGEEMLVPLVNSPRIGVCGYVGPSIEP